MVDKNSLSVPFTIDHIDFFAQGVSKVGEHVYFIPKTLPGEQGQCWVFKKKSKIFFAQTDPASLLKKSISPLRTEPTCPHYQLCHGCHYLHTSYQEEQRFKTAAFARLLAQLKKKGMMSTKEIHNPLEENILFHPAPRRDFYRQRLQLHYDAKNNFLGFYEKYKQGRLEVPACRLPTKELQEAFTYLYTHKTTLLSEVRLKAKAPAEGYIVLYVDQHGQAKWEWNTSYTGSEGFVQINGDVNQQIQKKIAAFLEDTSSQCIYDLFGGSGNLMKYVSPERTKITVDLHLSLPHEAKENTPYHRFDNVDLFSQSSFASWLKKQKKEESSILILDPPRTGWNFLGQFCEEMKPEKIFYLSCHPQTQMRDLESLKDHYQIVETHLFDMFPGTYHMESLIFLERIKKL
jgi:23S rRNA (uracil1939-C5)-methyltransferase